MYLLLFGWVLVLAAAQPSPSAAPEPTETSPSLSPKPTGSVPTTTFAGPKTTSVQNSVANIAATEQILNVEKPTKAPLTTKPDTWTPAGLTGAGLPFQPGQVNLPQLPYDPNQSQKTLAEILQQQQQQQPQPPVEYDMFGFPINNAADTFDPFAGLFDFGTPTPAPQADNFFGNFGGAVRDPNQGGLFGGSATADQGLFGGFGGAGNAGGGFGGNNMMQTMLLMQLLGGDAPDPPSTPAGGRGRGRGGQGRGPLSQLSPIERALMLEQRRIMREQQRNQQLMTRNQGWQQQGPPQGRGPAPWNQGPPKRGPAPWNQGPPNRGTAPWNQGPPNRGPAPWNQGPPNANNWIPPPPRTRTRGARAANDYPATGTRYEYPVAGVNNNRIPKPAPSSFHPAVLDRNNMVTQAPTVQPGQEPVEIEAGNARQRRNRFSNEPGTSAPTKRPISAPANIPPNLPPTRTKTYPTAQGTDRIPNSRVVTPPPTPTTMVPSQSTSAVGNATPTPTIRGWGGNNLPYGSNQNAAARNTEAPGTVTPTPVTNGWDSNYSPYGTTQNTAAGNVTPTPPSRGWGNTNTINNINNNLPFDARYNIGKGQGQVSNPFFARRNNAANRPGMNSAIPRNLQQLMSSPQFQRNLRTQGLFPSSNPADAQADRADMMADRMDNLQSMSPLQRLLNAQMGGSMFGGMGGGGESLFASMLGSSMTGMGSSPFAGLGSSPFTGFGASPLAILGTSPLANIGAAQMAGMGGSPLSNSLGAARLAALANRRAQTPRQPTQLDSVLGNLFG